MSSPTYRNLYRLASAKNKCKTHFLSRTNPKLASECMMALAGLEEGSIEAGHSVGF